MRIIIIMLDNCVVACCACVVDCYRNNTNAYVTLFDQFSREKAVIFRIIVVAEDLLFPDHSDQLDPFLSQTAERIVTS